jgi:hypothetical protein
MEDENKIAETTENTTAVADPAQAAPAPATTPAPVEEVRTDKLSKGKYAEYSDHDLQYEILKYEKKAARRTMHVATALFAIAAVFVVAAIIIVPPVLRTLDQVQTTLEEATSLVSKAEDTLTNVDDSLNGMNAMISNVDGVLTDNTAAMEEAITKISNIDVDGLNSSIEDLNKVVSAMGRLFRA